MKRIKLQVGRRGWVVIDTARRDPVSLPRGLVDGIVVEVVSAPIYGWVKVRDPQGRFWELKADCHLDMGRNFFIEDKWVREDDPRVLDAWQQKLREIEALPKKPGPPGWPQYEAASRLRILLRRHGQCPPACK